MPSPRALTADGFDSTGVAELTKRRRPSVRLACETADPYRWYRRDDFGIARPETATDGVHLNEYATADRAIDGQIRG